jgi:DNA-binding response OmpR family regulator
MSARGPVLIIDHDARRTETLKKNLTNNGYSFVIVVNRKDALASIPDREPNLVLITTSLPDTTPSAISLVKFPGFYFL